MYKICVDGIVAFNTEKFDEAAALYTQLIKIPILSDVTISLEKDTVLLESYERPDGKK